PEADPCDRQARQLSTQGEGILRSLRIADHLKDALADCVFMCGTSARTGGLYRKHTVLSPSQAMDKLVASLAHGRVALVFGPERTGLTNEEVCFCLFLKNIRPDSASPAMNLAQAVAVCLYELRRCWLQRGLIPFPITELAGFADVDRMLSHLQTALKEI